MRAAADADAARTAAGRLRGDLASYLTAHSAAAQARAAAAQCAPDTAALDPLAELTSERERWRALLTTPATEAAPASAPTAPDSP